MRRKWYIGVLILSLFLIVVGAHLYFSSESYIRERYPYRVNDLIGFDPSTPSYLTLEHLIGPNDVIIHGKFTGEKEKVQAVLLPDENSRMYYGICNMAEMKGVSIEEAVSEMGYVKLPFQIDEVIEDGLDWEYQKGDIVEIYVYNGNSVIGYLPQLMESGEFVLFLTGYHRDGTAVYKWNGRDCFYVTPWNRVYTYQDTEELNAYNGKSVRYLSKAIKEIVREREEAK